jgi:hypothetical protein
MSHASGDANPAGVLAHFPTYSTMLLLYIYFTYLRKYGKVYIRMCGMLYRHFMTLKKKITVYIPDELDDWVKNDMPRNINLSEEVRIFLYSLRDKYAANTKAKT